MLIDLHYTSTEPEGIFVLLAQLNPHKGEEPFEHVAKGVYRIDNYKFNGHEFIACNCDEFLVDDCVAYGVCDNYKQVIDHYPELIADADHKYVILLSSVYKCDQPADGGWRWHKWGEYIGIQNSRCEYLYDEPEVEKVYCYKICEVD